MLADALPCHYAIADTGSSSGYAIFLFRYCQLRHYYATPGATLPLLPLHYWPVALPLASIDTTLADYHVRLAGR